MPATPSITLLFLHPSTTSQPLKQPSCVLLQLPAQLLSRMQAQRLHIPQHHVCVVRKSLVVRADASARVRGDARRVQRWLSDVRQWSSFYPGTKSAVKLGSGLDPIRVGTKFETQRDMLGLKLPMQYEILEISPGKRLVLSGLSEHHTQMDQFFFMADRHDPSFCCVRYMTDVRLREWKVYLQPVAKRFMSKVPDEAMANLQKTLNVAGSPVYSSEFEEVYRQEQRSASSSKASSRSGSKANSRGGTTSDRPSSNGTSRSGLSSGWLKNMFTGRSMDGDDGSSTSSSGRLATALPVVLDPMGYYEVLGLTPAIELDEEEIKSAYRRLAMQYHPDRHITSDAAARAAAEKRFAALLKAYDTLKDPEQRALYNAGHLVEASLNL